MVYCQQGLVIMNWRWCGGAGNIGPLSEAVLVEMRETEVELVRDGQV